MTTFKCKMCGGTIEFNPGDTVCTCEYCNTKQTLPRLDDDRRASLYDRASHFRRNNEFDKAMAIYEQIIIEDNTDAEAYWSLVLCKYGIEYVEDPDTHKRVPTVNRTQYTSVLVDEDYKKAVQYASVEQRILYEDEAKTIDEILRGILEISSKEAPFDIFICYKETDNDGRRTRDSVMATDIYNQLTQEGYKVFFSRITLEDKFGTAYEPYIFAALNSAKVMIVVGTKLEYFNATWVKNEWSRYLGLIKKGEKKVLIPVYKDIDPYDIPEEFAYLQAQDMSRLGFLQDLVRGIKKIIGANEPSNTQPAPTVVQTYSSNITALLDRGNMAIEDGEWDKADGFFEEVLNQDAKCAEAYLGKFLVANHVKNLDDYKQKIERETEYAEPQRRQLSPDTEHIDQIVEKYTITNYLSEDDLRKMYAYDMTFESNRATREQQKAEFLAQLQNDRMFSRVKQFASGETASEIESVIAGITKTMDTRITDAKKGEEETVSRINKEYADFISETDAKVERRHRSAKSVMENDYQSAIVLAQNTASIESCNKAKDRLAVFKGYKDADATILGLDNSIKEIIRKQEEDKQRRKKKIKRITIAAVSLIAIVSLAILTKTVFIPTYKYDSAQKLMDQGKYEEAIEAFEKLDGYKDSEKKIEQCNEYILNGKYQNAVALMDDQQYEDAIAAFEELSDYRDSAAKIEECNSLILEDRYQEAIALMDNQQYEEAIAVFEELDGYKNSLIQINTCNNYIDKYEKYTNAISLMENEHYEEALSILEDIGNYQDSMEQAKFCRYTIAMNLINNEQYAEALPILEENDDYQDSMEQADVCRETLYQQAQSLVEQEQYVEASALLELINGYKDSDDILIDIKLDVIRENGASVGDKVRFGNYQGEGEWIVLDVSESDILLINSNYVAIRRFDDDSDSWDNSEIKTWLNNTYYSNAFTTDERSMITDHGNGKVFLLSLDEFEYYCDIYGGIKWDFRYCSWWLRSPGTISNYVQYVSAYGDVYDFGLSVDTDCGVRPAIWIKLD